jgi:hypothetical protein
MHPETLRVSQQRTQSVHSGVTTQSVGTIETIETIERRAPWEGL